MTTTADSRRERAQALKLHGLLAHWDEVRDAPWLPQLLAWEEQERARRSLARRLDNAPLGPFKPLADFDGDWPAHCDRQAVETLMRLDFLAATANVVLLGPNGVGKSTLARNIAHPAVLAGHTVRFASAGQRLGDLLFKIVSRRYEQKSTLVTTHRPFSEWNQVFPNAACVVSLIDRLVHHAEILSIEGESYRLKAARERAAQRQAARLDNPTSPTCEPLP
jgi:DNA replication protein DnaC